MNGNYRILNTFGGKFIPQRKTKYLNRWVDIDSGIRIWSKEDAESYIKEYIWRKYSNERKIKQIINL